MTSETSSAEMHTDLVTDLLAGEWGMRRIRDFAPAKSFPRGLPALTQTVDPILETRAAGDVADSPAVIWGSHLSDSCYRSSIDEYSVENVTGGRRLHPFVHTLLTPIPPTPADSRPYTTHFRCRVTVL